jgi:hypothetical protein
MKMTPELWAALLNFATKFTIDAAIAIAKHVNNPDATVDDAIEAMDAISKKTWEDLQREARERAGLPPEPASTLPGRKLVETGDAVEANPGTPS